jgi:uncharacterized 2Fe-2S/4Fe-4S cluster protein (DUF4445 family)
MEKGERIHGYTMVNSQRYLGADVITRIKLASEGKQNELHQLLIDDIHRGIAVFSKDITHMVITGNTTMLHLLLNQPCESLGQFPFTPFTVATQTISIADCEAYVLPGISAFVGADIVAGLYFCGIENLSLFIDLGTNGEMALCTRDKIYVTSTAAGPAFEAGNITHGMGSVTGAIAHVRIDKNKNVINETIGNTHPVGLCGTGVVSLAAELVRHKITDETGLLDDEYFDDGFPLTDNIIFTQKDMREIQLAKSAVRSGIEILLETAGLTCDDIQKLYLAGGFGHKMDLHSAVTLGIIPKVLQEKVISVGNAALGGAVRTLLKKDAPSDVTAITEKAEEINLSAHPKFNTYFMEYMMF